MNELYFIEIAGFLLLAIIGTIILIKKDAKKALLFLALTLVIFIICFIATFAFEKPSIELKKNQTIEVKTEFSKPKTIYHFKDVTDSVTVSGNVDTNTIGEYTVNVEVPTTMGKYTESFKVKVVDTKAPEITLEGDEEFKQSGLEEFVDPGYSAIDLYEGDITDKVETEIQEINSDEYNIIYKVKDSSGNSAEKKRHVVVEDTVPPEISLNEHINMYINIGDEYSEPGATAVDKRDGDVSNTLEINGSVDTSKEGVNVITYTAKDKSGNEATLKRYVLVSEAGKVHPQDGTAGEKGVIYLTFDDGPTETSTPQILDILDKKGVKATFFIINYSAENEALVKREHDSGHTVAIHGYSHTYSQIYQSEETYLNNITMLQNKIKDTIGEDVTITRFPGGSSNTISKHYNIGIMTRLCYEMVSRGYTYFDWNVDSDDAGSAKSSDDVYRNVTSRLSKDKANVVLMHDFSNNTKTIGALESIIEYGLNNGYTFKTLTPETAMVTHSTNN